MENSDLKLNYLKDYIANRKRIVLTLLGFYLATLIFLFSFRMPLIDESQLIGAMVGFFGLIVVLTLLIICIYGYEVLENFILKTIIKDSKLRLDLYFFKTLYFKLKLINIFFYFSLAIFIFIVMLALFLFLLDLLLAFAVWIILAIFIFRIMLKAGLND